jgi:AhpD family alkylhydroperoxidase
MPARRAAPPPTAPVRRAVPRVAHETDRGPAATEARPRGRPVGDAVAARRPGRRVQERYRLRYRPRGQAGLRGSRGGRVRHDIHHRITTRSFTMALMKKIEYADASPEVREVYDDIMSTRKIDWINNLWKVIANHPPTLRSLWTQIKTVMAPGALDPLTKELIYVAVSVTNNCDYCIYSHTAAARRAGMTDAQFAELIQVVALANAGNRIANGYQVEVDERFRGPN